MCHQITIKFDWKVIHFRVHVTFLPNFPSMKEASRTFFSNIVQSNGHKSEMNQKKGHFTFLLTHPPNDVTNFISILLIFRKAMIIFRKNKTSSTIERRERHKRCRLWSMKKKKSFSSCFPSPLIYSSFHLSFPSLKIRKVGN